ncbi:hypothetical protein KAU86_03525 [bacterium]|nr:hypothetical protein [bacterium]
MSVKRFSGIKFDNNCYDSDEARKFLDQLMKVIEDSIQATYRGMRIRGKYGLSKRYGVWGIFSDKENKDKFKHPHFTVGIQRQKAVVALTIPNGASKKEYWDKVMNPEKYCRKIEEIRPEVRNLYFWLEQRHAAGGHRGSELVNDATMEIDPAVGERYARQEEKIKMNRYWMEALSSALQAKSREFKGYVNMQLQFRVDYWYYGCPIVKKPEFANKVSSVIRSFSPLYDYLCRDTPPLILP